MEHHSFLKRRQHLFDGGTCREVLLPCRLNLPRPMGERTKRRMGEHITRHNRDTGTLRTPDELKNEDRISAALEKVVIESRGIGTKNVAPNGPERFFARRCRRDMRNLVRT